MRQRAEVPFRNRNHSGWWIFREVECWVSKRQKSLLPSSRCLVWENTRLLRAKSREEAYGRALKMGRAGHPSKSKDGEWRFAGVSMLLPVYEDIGDRAEVLWVDRGLMTLSKIKKLAKTKCRLSVFDDKTGHDSRIGGDVRPAD